MRETMATKLYEYVDMLETAWHDDDPVMLTASQAKELADNIKDIVRIAASATATMAPYGVQFWNRPDEDGYDETDGEPA